MKLKSITKIGTTILTAFCILTAILLIAIGYADRVSPEQHPIVATVTLAYPAAIILNLLALAVCLFLKPSRSFLPIVAFVMAFSPVRNYCPFNLKNNIDEADLKIVSFNIMSWNKWKGDTTECFIAKHLARMNADIMCLQEASTSDVRQKEIDRIMQAVYPYRDTAYIKQKGNMEVLYSKTPILRHERIFYESANNHSTAFYIQRGSDTILVINNHFESNCLIAADKAAFDSIVKGESSTHYTTVKTKSLLEKVAIAASKRGPQAIAVGEYIDRHTTMPIILCGDFNDGPNSFVHRQMAKRLTDCYVSAGFGPGISYHESHFYFRIDHIFCSKDFIPVRAEIYKNDSLSDHYPVVAWVKTAAKD